MEYSVQKVTITKLLYIVRRLLWKCKIFSGKQTWGNYFLLQCISVATILIAEKWPRNCNCKTLKYLNCGCPGAKHWCAVIDK